MKEWYDFLGHWRLFQHDRFATHRHNYEERKERLEAKKKPLTSRWCPSQYRLL